MGLIELPNSKSTDFYLRNLQRVRIGSSGCIRPLSKIPKSYFVMTYFPSFEDNYIAFHVCEQSSLSNSPTGEISFNSTIGNLSNQTFHTVSFTMAALKSKRGHNYERGNIATQPIVVRTREQIHSKDTSRPSSKGSAPKSPSYPLSPLPDEKTGRVESWLNDQAGVRQRGLDSCGSSIYTESDPCTPSVIDEINDPVETVWDW